MKPQDQLLERYQQAKAQLPSGLPQEPSSALHEIIMQAAREQTKAMNSIASHADSIRVTALKEHKNTAPTTEAANDSFWNIKAFASLTVMGLSALLWWQFEQGTPQVREAAKSAEPSRAVVAIAPTTVPAPPVALDSAAPNEALSESPRAEKNVSASAPKPVAKAAPAPIAQQAEAASAAPPLAAQRSRAQDMAAAQPDTAAPQTANADAAITPDTAERSASAAAAKSAPSAQASKRLSAEAPMALARPPLLVALQERDAAALRQALAESASPNLRLPDGNPALTQAVIQRWAEGVRILLASGADRNAKNSRSHTAADVAQELGDREIIELLKAAL